ncbi:MFS transporter [Microbacterium sp. 5K110]|jgi:fucose permease|uniref:MFS transporter n=1 Tax=unclassified Microbacterium TaxID=2609290 RepID=UPI0010FE6F7F|nr:MFS transporter [Microbacterium sp. 5K110]TLF31838.1 MFS transporter [Microbacterium sp. 5K110]
MDSVLTRARLVRWYIAICAIFLASGLSISTWASRVPAIRESLGIENSGVGLLLLGMGVASIIGLSVAPVIMARLGARRGMLAALACVAVGVVIIGLGSDTLQLFGVALVGLALFGFGNGSVDVMMNVEGAALEKATGRTVMPLLHAFFSFGTVIGAGIGFLAVRGNVDVIAHCVAMGIVIAVVAVVAIANVPARETAMDAAPAAQRAHWRERLGESLSAWREPRTYTLGVIMLGMAFAEGSANDWLPSAVVFGHGAPEEAGPAVLAVFSVAMTLGRLAGGPVVDRFGRVWVLRILAVTAAAGLLLFIVAPFGPLVYIGAALWGLGASLGFPIGMSAAADDPAQAASRVAAAATIGYVAFLCGPPILGWIGDHIGLLNTLLIVVGLIVASGLFSGAAKPLVVADDAEAEPAQQA